MGGVKNPYPQVNYGHRGGEWNPDKRSSVYRQVERARSEADFAQKFMADILFSKPESGSFFWTQDSALNTRGQQEGGGRQEQGNAFSPKKMPRPKERGTIRFNGLNQGFSRDPQPHERDAAGNALRRESAGRIGLGEGARFQGSGDWLENKNTLNAAASWVGQAFLPPVVRGEDGSWRKAETVLRQGKLLSGKPLDPDARFSHDYAFRPGEAVSDPRMIRLLEDGHHAFSAKGYDGSTAYVLFADDYALAKGGQGRAEADRAKKDHAKGRPVRKMVGPGQALPGNVIGGRSSVLGRSGPQEKTLLGASLGQP